MEYLVLHLPSNFKMYLVPTEGDLLDWGLGMGEVMKLHYMKWREKIILSSFFLMYKMSFLLVKATFGWEC